ncbi:hypothetical protein A2U01_0054695 [Trifolium medium]|uniref:Uncharacterized protein n=1 Tax=Trifolium medium TaxID=97028 RepID=A0A392RA01_9FABA|nr:hypothetical protein [Trifolium medium]
MYSIDGDVRKNSEDTREQENPGISMTVDWSRMHGQL